VPYNCSVTFTTLFFDLDDTLYPPQNGVWSAIRERMNIYMLEKLSLPADQIASLRRFYFETYGTTLRGLQAHYHVDADDFLAFVHDLPIRKMVQPDAGLRSLLLSLPQRKFIFTNADSAHAGRILEALELQECFDGIIDVRRLNFHCKPEPVVYQMALDLAGESSPQRCIYLDDSPRNLAPARPLGFFTILVGDETNHNAADRAIRSLHDLPQAIPELWQDHHRA
jgi:putative hydrolase of the HAD superfamily